MNALLRETRAIVTSVPGTTRDTIEEMLTIRGIPVKLTDTAGIRETKDLIEKIGIEKSKEAFNNADLIIFMADRSRMLDEEDFSILNHIGNKKAIVILNKTDLPKAFDRAEIEKLLPEACIIEAAVANRRRYRGTRECRGETGVRSEVKQSDSMMVTMYGIKICLKKRTALLVMRLKWQKPVSRWNFLRLMQAERMSASAQSSEKRWKKIL